VRSSNNNETTTFSSISYLIQGWNIYMCVLYFFFFLLIASIPAKVDSNQSQQRY
jgi:hypothetical protein